MELMNSGKNIKSQDLIKPISQNITFIFFISALLTLFSFLLAKSIPDTYRSEALGILIEDDNASISNSLNQYQDLASLAGINIDSISNGGNKADYLFAKINSRDFLTQFISTRSLKDEILASQGWNPVENKFLYSKKIYDESKNIWTRSVKEPKESEPSLNEVYEFFIKKNLSVIRNDTNGFFIISMKSYSPFAARDWITWLIADFNQLIKNEDINEANRSIIFLEGELKRSANNDVRELLNALIEKETKILALANSKEEYALRTIDSAYLPEEKFSPNIGIIMLLGFTLGFLVSVVISYFAFSRDKIIQLKPSFRFITLKNIESL